MTITVNDNGDFLDSPKFDQYLAKLEDLARNIAGFDDRLLVSADLNVLRSTLNEFRTQAREVGS